MTISGTDKNKLSACSHLLENKVKTFVCNIRSNNSVEELFQSVKNQDLKINTLVITAGIQTTNRNLLDLSDEEWKSLFETHVDGLRNIFKHLLPYISEHKDPHVILVTSIAAKNPSLGGGTGYTASKHAVQGLIDTLRLEEKWKHVDFRQ